MKPTKCAACQNTARHNDSLCSPCRERKAEMEFRENKKQALKTAISHMRLNPDYINVTILCDVLEALVEQNTMSRDNEAAEEADAARAIGCEHVFHGEAGGADYYCIKCGALRSVVGL